MRTNAKSSFVAIKRLVCVACKDEDNLWWPALKYESLEEFESIVGEELVQNEDYHALAKLGDDILHMSMQQSKDDDETNECPKRVVRFLGRPVSAYELVEDKACMNFFTSLVKNFKRQSNDPNLFPDQKTYFDFHDALDEAHKILSEFRNSPPPAASWQSKARRTWSAIRGGPPPERQAVAPESPSGMHSVAAVSITEDSIASAKARSGLSQLEDKSHEEVNSNTRPSTNNATESMSVIKSYTPWEVVWRQLRLVEGWSSIHTNEGERFYPQDNRQQYTLDQLQDYVADRYGWKPSRNSRKSRRTGVVRLPPSGILWDILKNEGWEIVKAKNDPLTTYYYVKSGKNVKEGTLNVDYFANFDCLEDYCREFRQDLYVDEDSPCQSSTPQPRRLHETFSAQQEIAEAAHSDSETQSPEGSKHKDENPSRGHDAESSDEDNTTEDDRTDDGRSSSSSSMGESSADDPPSVMENSDDDRRSQDRSTQSLTSQPQTEDSDDEFGWDNVRERTKREGWRCMKARNVLQDWWWVLPGRNPDVEGVDYFASQEDVIEYYRNNNTGKNNNNKNKAEEEPKTSGPPPVTSGDETCSTDNDTKKQSVVARGKQDTNSLPATKTPGTGATSDGKKSRKRKAGRPLTEPDDGEDDQPLMHMIGTFPDSVVDKEKYALKLVKKIKVHQTPDKNDAPWVTDPLPKGKWNLFRRIGGSHNGGHFYLPGEKPRNFATRHSSVDEAFVYMQTMGWRLSEELSPVDKRNAERVMRYSIVKGNHHDWTGIRYISVAESMVLLQAIGFTHDKDKGWSPPPGLKLPLESYPTLEELGEALSHISDLEHREGRRSRRSNQSVLHPKKMMALQLRIAEGLHHDNRKEKDPAVSNLKGTCNAKQTDKKPARKKSKIKKTSQATTRPRNEEPPRDNSGRDASVLRRHELIDSILADLSVWEYLKRCGCTYSTGSYRLPGNKGPLFASIKELRQYLLLNTVHVLDIDKKLTRHELQGLHCWLKFTHVKLSSPFLAVAVGKISDGSIERLIKKIGFDVVGSQYWLFGKAYAFEDVINALRVREDLRGIGEEEEEAAGGGASGRPRRRSRKPSILTETEELTLRVWAAEHDQPLMFFDEEQFCLENTQSDDSDGTVELEDSDVETANMNEEIQQGEGNAPTESKVEYIEESHAVVTKNNENISDDDVNQIPTNESDTTAIETEDVVMQDVAADENNNDDDERNSSTNDDNTHEILNDTSNTSSGTKPENSVADDVPTDSTREATVDIESTHESSLTDDDNRAMIESSMREATPDVDVPTNLQVQGENQTKNDAAATTASESGHGTATDSATPPPADTGCEVEDRPEDNVDDDRGMGLLLTQPPLDDDDDGDDEEETHSLAGGIFSGEQLLITQADSFDDF